MLGMLGLIGIIFFTEANMVIVIRSMLITPLLLNSACRASRPLLFLTLPLHMNRLGTEKRFGEATDGRIADLK